MAQIHEGGVFVVALDVILYFRATAELLADVQRMDWDEVQSASFFALDGEVLELARTTRFFELRPTGRHARGELEAVFARVSGGEGDTHPRVVANQVLSDQWVRRRPSRPRWIHRLLHGATPPTV